MAKKSFIEVLEERIRADLKVEMAREQETAVRSQNEGRPRPHGTPIEFLEGWLIGQVNRAEYPAPDFAKRAYARPTKRAATASTDAPAQKPAKVEKRIRPVTTLEICAFELIKRHGDANLKDLYSETELKTAWRRAALSTHPDRFSQSDHATLAQKTELFRELAEAFALLVSAFAQDEATAPAA